MDRTGGTGFVEQLVMYMVRCKWSKFVKLEILQIQPLGISSLPRPKNHLLTFFDGKNLVLTQYASLKSTKSLLNLP